MREKRARRRHGIGASPRAALAGLLVALPLIAMTAGAATAQGLVPPDFVVLDFDPTGAFETDGLRLSGDGGTVVGTLWASSGLTADGFRWQPVTGFEVVIPGLGELYGGRAKAASYDGSVVVGEDFTTSFRWTAASGAVPLGLAPGGPAYVQSQVWDVSADGSVVVGCAAVSGGLSEGFRWTAATGMVPLGLLPGGVKTLCATAVSADGSVVVGVTSEPAPFGPRAFRWTQAAGPLPIGVLPGGDRDESWPFDVTPDGSVVVGWSTSPLGFEPFRWTEQTGMVGLGELVPGATLNAAQAVTADGSVVVGYSGTDAFVWDELNGMRELETVLEDLGVPTIGPLTNATSIADDGSVILGASGAPSAPSGFTWVAAIPVPEPSVASLQAAGLGGVIVLRALRERGSRRRRKGVALQAVGAL